MLTWEGSWPNSLVRRPPWLQACSVKNKQTRKVLEKTKPVNHITKDWFSNQIKDLKRERAALKECAKLGLTISAFSVAILVMICTYFTYSVFHMSIAPSEELCTKVHIFWEGHKILRNLHQLFDLHMYCQSNNWWRFRKHFVAFSDYINFMTI